MASFPVPLAPSWAPNPPIQCGFWWQGDFLFDWGFGSMAVSSGCHGKSPFSVDREITIFCWPRYQVTFYLRFPFNFIREMDGYSSQGKLLPFHSEFPFSFSKCRIKVPRPSSLKASQPSGPRRTKLAHPPLFPQVCGLGQRRPDPTSSYDGFRLISSHSSSSSEGFTPHNCSPCHESLKLTLEFKSHELVPLFFCIILPLKL